MISIKKYLDERTMPKLDEIQDEPFSVVVDTYRSALVAVARATSLNGSPQGVELGSRLIGLHRRVGTKPSVETVRQAEIEFESNLAAWSKRAEAEGCAKDNEIKELILALAKTAETVVMRGQKNTSQFRAVTGQLEKIGSLNDIRQIRNSIVQRVSEFRSSIEQMNRENWELVAELQGKIITVESRLKSAENLALTDTLTAWPTAVP
jgi:hypothetical protein